MKLAKVCVTDFQSVHDSTEFDIGDVTCRPRRPAGGRTRRGRDSPRPPRVLRLYSRPREPLAVRRIVGRLVSIRRVEAESA